MRSKIYDDGNTKKDGANVTANSAYSKKKDEADVVAMYSIIDEIINKIETSPIIDIDSKKEHQLTEYELIEIDVENEILDRTKPEDLQGEITRKPITD